MMPGVMTDWMWIWPALVVAGLLLIGYVAVRLVQGGGWKTSAPGAGPHDSAARRILDERFARSEIDEDEYQRRRRLLP